MRVFIAAIFAVLAVPALAHWKPEYAQLPQSVQDWYSRAELTPAAQKRLGFVGCCDSGDRVLSKFRARGGKDGLPHWFYLKTPADPNSWTAIPDDIVHWNESAPDNKPTLFALSRDINGSPKGTLTCFYPPSGGM